MQCSGLAQHRNLFQSTEGLRRAATSAGKLLIDAVVVHVKSWCGICSGYATIGPPIRESVRRITKVVHSEASICILGACPHLLRFLTNCAAKLVGANV
jgi:hypothetical protein